MPVSAPSTVSTPEARSKERVGRWRITRLEPRATPGGAIVLVHSTTATSPEPADWMEPLLHALTSAPNIVCVGAKRLAGDGRVFSMGEFLIHPKGFHHLGRGVEHPCFRLAEEVDLVAGGVFAIREDAFEAAGGAEALKGELGVLELGLELRKNGGRVFTIPQVVVPDEWSPSPSAREASAFAIRWGFDWNIPDLDAVRRVHRGTGLLWNLAFHLPGMPFEKYTQRGPMHWSSYEKAEPYRQRADHLMGLVDRFARAGPANGTTPKVLDLGCGDGLFTHLLASKGLQVIGIDPEDIGIEQAWDMTGRNIYPDQRPQFITGAGEAMPFEDNEFQAIALLDVIEHLPNPVAVLREAARVLAPGGCLVISTPAWQFGGSSDPVYHVTEYTMDELQGQVGAIEGLHITDTGTIGGIYRDLIIAARKG